jgi:hypothetical protein
MRSKWIVVLLATVGLIGCANLKAEDKKGEEKEGDEVKISFAECPAPVKATLNKESNNAKIESVDKETDEGKTIYEADVMMDGQNYEIKVAEDGKLISKKVDNEEGEKKGEKKGEKEEDEKNEKK